MTEFSQSANRWHFMKRLLPAPAIEQWFSAAKAAEESGTPYNDCIKLAWDDVHKDWVRDPGKPMYRRRKPKVKKAEPGPGDVHVPGTDWKKKKPKKDAKTVYKQGDEKTFFVKRPLLNGEDLLAWAASQGLPSMLDPADLHVTVAFSKEPVDWSQFEPDDSEYTLEESDREMHQFPARNTDNGALVLKFDSPYLQSRWKEFKDGGASWDFPEYKPHLTITYAIPDASDLDIEPYDGPLVFGPEEFNEVNDGWANNITEIPLKETEMTKELVQKIGARNSSSDMKKIQGIHDHAVSLGANCDHDMVKSTHTITARVIKVDEEQRMVYGWASVISMDGEPVVDLHGDIIEADVLEKAATEFMKDVRTHGNMHQTKWVIKGEDLVQEPVMVGMVVHSFPLIKQLSDALGISSPAEGWIVGVHVVDEPTWKSYKDGTFTGFSIGGYGSFHPLDETGVAKGESEGHPFRGNQWTG